MTIRFNMCDHCGCKFRVKKYNKPYIGLYNGKPVFHWYFDCLSCEHRHTVRYYNEFINTYYDKVKVLEWSLMLYKNDEDKFKELMRQYEIAKEELNKVNDEIIEACLTKRCS